MITCFGSRGKEWVVLAHMLLPEALNLGRPPYLVLELQGKDPIIAFFFFNDPPPTEISSLPHHAALPIFPAFSFPQEPATAPPPVPHGTAGQRVQSFFGLLVLLGLTWGIGRLFGARKRIHARTLIWG